MNDNHLLVNITQKALIVENDKLLMLLQDGDWELPGGRVDTGELDLIMALKREIREELSIEVEVKEIFTAYLFTRKTGVVSLAIIYKCNLIGSIDSIKPQQKEDVDDYKFYSKEELNKLTPIYVNSQEAIKRFLL